MINLSLNELKLIAQNRTISNYEKKSKNDLIKALREPKPKISINKKKLEEVRKDFTELRYNFSKKKHISIEKFFYDIKNYRHLYSPDIKKVRHISKSKIEDVRKNINKLKKI